MKKKGRIFVSTLMAFTFLLSNCKRENSSSLETVESSKKDTTSTISSTSLILDAAMYYSKDMYTEAASSYRKLIKIDSLNGEYYYRLAYCLAQLLEYPQAVKNFEKAASLNHRKFEAYRSVGLIYILSDKSKAIEYFNKCLEVDPNAEEIKKFINDIKNKPEEANL